MPPTQTLYALADVRTMAIDCSSGAHRGDDSVGDRVWFWCAGGADACVYAGGSGNGGDVDLAAGDAGEHHDVPVNAEACRAFAFAAVCHFGVTGSAVWGLAP